MKNSLLIILVVLSVSLLTGACNNQDTKAKSNITNTDESFEDIIKSEVPVIVDFYADWCSPCKTQGPIIDELANEMGDKVRVVKINVDYEEKLTEKYGIQSIPTIIVFQKGEIVWKAVGVQDKEILKNVVLGKSEVTNVEDQNNIGDFSQIIQSDIPVIVDFYAEWCGPCKIQGPIIDELKAELGNKVKVVKVDVDSEVELSQKYGIQSIPTLIVFQKGEIIWKAVGVQQKENLTKVIMDAQ